jgi:ATP-dependent DNA ligase
MNGEPTGCNKARGQQRSTTYLDGELCGLRPDGIISFSMIQTASDSGNAAGLVYFLFDLL